MSVATTVSELIQLLLPSGSNGDAGDWSDYPQWPPDMFAVACTLVERSSCYTSLLGSPDSQNSTEAQLADVSSQAGRDEVEQVGEAWRNGEFDTCDTPLQTYWAQLMGSAAPITTTAPWCIAALKLTLMADEASRGLGFNAQDSWVQVAYRVMADQQKSASQEETDTERASSEYLASACQFVPPDLACVQPKTRTPIVGCTVRSLTHHLALLPSKGQVKVRWHQYPIPDRDAQRMFNILIVPFPYQVHGKAFKVAKRDKVGNRAGYFGMEQPWLPRKASGECDPDKFWEFLSELIEECRKEVDNLDGIVLPELALDLATYAKCREELQSQHYSGIGFFISGVLTEDESGVPVNQARTSVYLPPLEEGGKAIVVEAPQKKHHRWKLDAAQIRAYSLGDRLDPTRDWWEYTSINDRNLSFFVFRNGACFTSLICEDLARTDPCQSVIRAIGPNLVFALLMDGPQINARWPGRYAMGLSEDPGSSVLSLTSCGLIGRSNYYYPGNARTIALWRDCTGVNAEIDLDEGDQASLLCLRQHNTEEYTLDGRGDRNNAHQWLLAGCLPVKISGIDRFPWLNGH